MSYWICIFIVGQLLLQFFSVLPAVWMIILSWILALLFCRGKLLIGIISLLAGFTWTYGHALWQLSLQIPDELENTAISVQGEIIAPPVVKPTSTQILFNTANWGTLQLSWYEEIPILKKGQIWDLTVRLKKPRNYANPGGFDYARYLFLNKISATGYIDPRGQSVLMSTAHDQFSIRQHIALQIDERLQQRDAAALIKGLAVGIRDTMTDAQWALLQKTGTSHLLAISGLHIGLVSGLVFFCMRRFWAYLPRMPLYIPAPCVAAVMAIFAAFIYAALAGFSLPTQRALIMIVVIMCAKISRYQFKNSDVLALSALLIVLWDPFAVYSASFWLSFIAVAILFFASQDKISKWSQALHLQWLISLGLTPFVIIYFKQIAWLSPVANMLAIPWASFTVVPLTLLGVLSSFIDMHMATFFWLLAESALNYLDGFLQIIAKIPYAWQAYAINDNRVLLALCGGVFLLLLPRAVPGKFLGVLLISALIFVRTPKPEYKEVWLTVLDVGQGLSSVIQTENHVLIYDAGMRFDTFDLGETVVMPFLKQNNIQDIDLLVLSHDNLDHTGGAPYLMQNLAIKRLVSGEPIRDLSVQERCRAGEQFEWDGVYFSFLYPAVHHHHNSNNNSCVLKITTGSQSILFTGDIESLGESWLIENAKTQLPSTILVAPHHGSRTSSTLPFVQAVKAEHVIFTTGYRNRYNFPRNDVVERYRTRNALIYNTADTGAVTFKISPENIEEIHLFREDNQYWWE